MPGTTNNIQTGGVASKRNLVTRPPIQLGPSGGTNGQNNPNMKVK